MSAGQVTVTDDGGRYLLVKGTARDILRDNKIPGMYAPADRGWHVRRERLADLLAVCDAQGVPVTLRGGAR